MDKQREEFEAWVREYGNYPRRPELKTSDGAYHYLHTESEWRAWQAAQAAQPAHHLPEAGNMVAQPARAQPSQAVELSDEEQVALLRFSELVKDAARYRWIRLGKPYRVVVDAPTKKKPDAKITIMVSPSPESDYARALDAAIDAAQIGETMEAPRPPHLQIKEALCLTRR